MTAPSDASDTTATVGPWTASRLSGELSGPEGVRTLEPKVMDLLFLLASRPGEVVTKEEIGEALWPDVHVGGDSLTRCVFKLRKALDDDPKAPRYIETIPKRGYRLKATEAVSSPPAAAAPATRRRNWAIAAFVVGVLTVLAGVLLLKPPPAVIDPVALTAQADDLYFQINRADNEQAIALYERALKVKPGHAAAQAGLANALVQQVIRWSAPPGPADARSTNLGRALASGVTRTPEARRKLGRASRLAEAAVEGAPQLPAAWKALGFVRSAQGDFPAALEAHRTAARLDPDAWDALINLADLYSLKGEPEISLLYLESAYAAMTRAAAREPDRVRPWQDDTAILVGRAHETAGRLEKAETWYRRVLSRQPLHPAASAGLARVLVARGDRAGAQKLCRDLADRIGPNEACVAISG